MLQDSDLSEAKKLGFPGPHPPSLPGLSGPQGDTWSGTPTSHILSHSPHLTSYPILTILLTQTMALKSWDFLGPHLTQHSVL